MNNVEKKNILYSLSTNYDLPYQTKNDVSLKANQIIYTSINNNLQKLVDNDLYTEKMLLDNYNYPVGPKSKTSHILSSSPDGYKIWDGISADSLSILHKIQENPENTLTQINGINSKINFLLENGEYMAATEGGLFRSQDGQNWSVVNSGVLSSLNVRSRYFSNDNDSVLFGTNKGLYQLSNVDSLGYSDEMMELTRKDDESEGLNGKCINSITLNAKNNELYLATDSGIYFGKHFNDANIKDQFTERFLEDMSITDVKTLSNGMTIAVTKEDGLYEKTSDYGLSAQVAIGQSIGCLFNKLKGMYVITSRGLYAIQGNHIVDVDGYQDKWIYDVLESGGNLFVATNAGLYKNGTLIDESTNINVLGEFYGLLVFGTDDGLYYVEMDKTSDIETMGKWKVQLEDVDSTVYGIQEHNTQLYVSTQDGMYVFDKRSTIKYGTQKKTYSIVGGTCQISEKVNCINKISTNKILIGTSNHCYIDIDGYLTPMSEGYEVLKATKDNGLFFLVEKSKIHVLNSSYEEQCVFETEDEILDTCVTDSGIMVTTNHNLYRYDIENNQIIEDSESQLFETIKTNLVGTVKIDDQVYLVSQDRLYILTEKSETVVEEVGNCSQQLHSVRYNSRKWDVFYYSSDGSMKYSYGPESQISDVPTDVLLTGSMNDIYFGTRTTVSKIYATDGNGLKWSNAYFDNSTGVLVSTDEVSSSQFLKGLNTTEMACVADVSASPELSNQTYMFVGTDSGLYYNKTRNGNIETKYPSNASKLVQMEQQEIQIEGTSEAGQVPQLMIGTTSDNLSVFSVFHDSKSGYAQRIVKAKKTINNVYSGYFTTKDEDDDGTSRTDVQPVGLLGTSEGFVGYPISNDVDADWRYSICDMPYVANGTSGYSIKLWAYSSESKNYLVTVGGKFLYNITDSLVSTFLGSKTFSKNDNLTVTGILDICVPTAKIMYLSKSDGLYRFSDLTSDIKGSTAPTKVQSGITNATRLLTIDSDSIMAVKQGYYYVVSTSDNSFTWGTLEGTLNNVQDMQKSIKIYTSERLYTYEKETAEMSWEVIPSDDILNSYETTDGTRMYFDSEKFYYLGWQEDDAYSRIQYQDMVITDVKSVRADSNKQLYILADNSIYKFTDSFETKKPAQVQLSIPQYYNILKIYIDKNDIVYYCVNGDGKLEFLQYKDDALIQRTTIQSYDASKFNGFYVWNSEIYVLQTDGNYKVVNNKLVDYTSSKVLSNKFTKINQVTYYSKNPILATDEGIGEYDVESDTVRYFNDSKLAKVKINKIYNSGDVYAASGESGISTFTDTTTFSEIEYLKGESVLQYLDDTTIGLEGGMFERYSYTVQDMSSKKELDYIVTKMWSYGGKLYCIEKDGFVNTMDHYTLNPYAVTIDGIPHNVEELFFVNSNKIFTLNGNTYDNGKLIDNANGSPSYMYGNGYGWYVAGGNLYRYSSIGDMTKFQKIENRAFWGLEMNQCLDIDGRMLLLGTSEGLKRYDSVNNVLEDIASGSVTMLREDFSEVDKYTELVKERYLYGTGNSVYKIYFGELYNDAEYVTEIYGFPNENVRDVIILNDSETIYGGDCGLYRTFYAYSLSDDFYTGQVSSVVNMISSSYKDIIDSHIEKYHNSSSTISKLAEKMPADMSDTSRLKENSNIKDVFNNVEFDDYNKYITASSRNANGIESLSVSDISGISYIKINNINGTQSDIYINIPTTNTYYCPHMKGVPNCSHDSESITQENSGVTMSRNMSDNLTYVDVILNNQHFEIQEINSVEVNGTSLPMKIFQNSDLEKYPDGSMFCSLIKPTMLYGFPDDLTEDEVKVNLVCFGTDEQCIHLRTSNIKTYIITYMYTNGNVFTQKKYKTFTPKEAEVTDEIVGGSLFKGWTINGQNIYKGDKLSIDVEYIGQTFEAYPIFEEYVFDYSDSTIFTLSVENHGFYINGDVISAETVVNYDSIIDSYIKIKSNKTEMKIDEVAVIDNQNVVVDWDYNYEDGD